MILKKIAQKFNTKQDKLAQGTTNPFDLGFEHSKCDFLNNLTQKALKMYERKCDIRNFTKLVLSNPENTSHNNIVRGLIQNGIIDPFEDDKLAFLADNDRLLRDLGLVG